MRGHKLSWQSVAALTKNAGDLRLDLILRQALAWALFELLVQAAQGQLKIQDPLADIHAHKLRDEIFAAAVSR